MSAGKEGGRSSLLYTIIWRLTAVTVVMILLVITFLAYRLYATKGALRDSSLLAQAGEIARYLRLDSSGKPHLSLPASLIEAYDALHGAFTYAVVDAQGRTLFSRDGLGHPLSPFDPEKAIGRISYFRLAPQGIDVPVYGATVAFERGGRRFWVQVAQSEANNDVLVESVVEEFFETSGWIFLVMLATLLAINIFTIRRSLRPLETASRHAAAIGPSTMDMRLSEKGLPRDIVPLVKAVNSALDRLENAFRVQREFAADAAHELRTPLAILTSRIGRLRDSDEAKTLKADVAVMSRIVAQLLEVAQIEDLTVQGDERADLSEICIRVAARLGVLAIDQGKSIAVNGAERPVPVRGNGESLFRAVRNLVENALAHTPVGTTVEIDVGQDASVRVTDRGPGIAPERREKVFQRFWRAERNRAGAGLGLAIVRGIAKAHGGSVEVGDAPADAEGRRGAAFTLRLPRA